MEQIELFYKTISKNMLELIEALMDLSCLRSFYLVGGTALALQIGHRESIDIDLFSCDPFDADKMAETLKSVLNPEQIEIAENSLSIFINGIKTDILTHAYPWLSDTVKVKNLRLASLKDIAAMKLNAISGRGLRKDYLDVYFLLEHYSLSEMINLFELKYPEGSAWHLIRAIVDIDSADKDRTPIINCLELDWEKVKKRIKRTATQLL